jgi:hypothetical protein
VLMEFAFLIFTFILCLIKNANIYICIYIYIYIYRFLIHQMNLLPLTNSCKQKEWQTIKHIAGVNGFPLQLLNSMKTRMIRQDGVPKHPTDPHRKWITLTYFGPYVCSISNLFKQADIRVACRTTDKIANLLRIHPRHNNSEYENSGIYSLRCATCHLAYIGQTGCSLQIRYSEHSRYIRSNSPLPAYAQHVLQQ